MISKIYQIYSLKSPDLVYDILKKYKADYVILEDSICFHPKTPVKCRLNEIIDLDNKHV